VLGHVTIGFVLPEHIGRYEVRGVAGSGGFATVYEGFDPRLDAPVAIKVLADNWSRDPEIVRRFRREAVLLRRLSTEFGVPGLVEVFDIDQAETGQPFFVMGWADRGTLGDRAGGKRWPYEQVAPIVEALTQSLGHLHSRSVVHRDVKPANLLLRCDSDDPPATDRLLGPGERLVVGDLGLAKDFLDDASALSLVAGTDRYMAPEQLVFGGSIDHRADIFAASAMVAELLGGDDGTPPDPYRGVLEKGMAERVDDRFGSMSEWRTALQRAHDKGPSTPTAASTERRSGVGVKAAAGAAVAAALLGGALVWNGSRSGIDIVGPDVVISGEVGVYALDDQSDANPVWLDPAGNQIESPTLEVTGRLPGQLEIAVEVGAESTTRTITVSASPQGPVIVGPDTVARGAGGRFTATIPHRPAGHRTRRATDRLGLMRPPSRTRLSAASDEDRPELIDALARAAADGDQDAAGDLAWAILHFRLARGPIREYLVNDADADAAEQATLVAVALRIGSWRGEARFTTWLWQVARNEARQLIRSERRHSDRAEPGDPIDHAEAFVARVSSMVADAQIVQRTIALLGDNHRQALLLREQQGMTYDEIAGELDVPVNTAKSWVRRARAELAERLTEAISGQSG